MAKQIEKAIEDWCCGIDEEELQEALESLQLKPDGRRLQRIARLQKWLFGEYSAEDFTQSRDSSEQMARIKREGLRMTFIEDTSEQVSTRSLYTGDYDAEHPHPLKLLRQEIEAKRIRVTPAFGEVYSSPAQAAEQQRPEGVIQPGLPTGETSSDDQENARADNVVTCSNLTPTTTTTTATTTIATIPATAVTIATMTIATTAVTPSAADNVLRWDAYGAAGNTPTTQQRTVGSATTTTNTWRGARPRTSYRQNDNLREGRYDRGAYGDVTHATRYDWPEQSLMAQNEQLSRSIAENTETMKALMNKLDAMMTQWPTNIASSTRVEPQHSEGNPQYQRKTQHVNFQDTFGINYVNHSSFREDVEAANGVNTAQWPPANTNDSRPPVVARGGRNANVLHTPARASSISSNNNDGSQNHGNRSIALSADKWGIKFTGDTTTVSVDHFLQRMEGRRRLNNLSDYQMLASLQEVLTDNAYEWLQNRIAENGEWTSWEEFKECILQWYHPSIGYQQRLMREAMSRTQGQGEPVRVYINNIQGIMRRMTPKMALDQQLDIIYHNLLPSYKRGLHRKDYTTVEQLLSAATEVEAALACEASYVAPPKPGVTVVPECSFKKGQVAAIDVVETNETTPLSLAAIGKLIDSKLAAVAQKPKPANAGGNGKKPPPQRGRPGPKRSGNKSQSPKRQNQKASDGTEKSDQSERKGPFECFNCHGKGHMSRDCPTAKGNAKKEE